MNATKVYKAIENALNTFQTGSDEYKVMSFYLRELMDDCKAEIASSALSGNTKDVYKSALAFATKCRKKNWESRPALAGAFIMDDGKQAICDGYTLAVYDKPFDALPMMDTKNNKPLDVKAILNFKCDARGVLPEVQTLRAAFKTAKIAHTGKDKFIHYTKIETPFCDVAIWFNTELLIQAMELAGSRNFEYVSLNARNAIKIIGDGTLVLQMPIAKMADDYISGYVHTLAA